MSTEMERKPTIILVILDGINQEIFTLLGRPPSELKHGSRLQNHPAIFKAIHSVDGKLHKEKIEAAFPGMHLIEAIPIGMYLDIIHVWYD